MNPHALATILAITDQFYQNFAASFAGTRRRIQPGVRRILERLPPDGAWLDLGCGSGPLAVEWARSGRAGAYLGIDQSEELLAEARKAVAEAPLTLPSPPIAGKRAFPAIGGEGKAGLEIRFLSADLGAAGWSAGLGEQRFDGAFCFAVLHHIPTVERRVTLLREAAGLLRPGAFLALSVWQFQHAPRLLARVQPWERVGLRQEDVDPGDVLLDWRASEPLTAAGVVARQARQPGLRYVHLFNIEALADLAQASGFTVRETFESDGEGGRLGLYQVWER